MIAEEHKHNPNHAIMDLAVHRIAQHREIIVLEQHFQNQVVVEHAQEQNSRIVQEHQIIIVLVILLMLQTDAELVQEHRHLFVQEESAGLQIHLVEQKAVELVQEEMFAIAMECVRHQLLFGLWMALMK